jgi:hypothetical protein
MAGERHGRGKRTASYVWIGLYSDRQPNASKDLRTEYKKTFYALVPRKTLIFICPRIANIIPNYNQQAATFLDLFIPTDALTCFTLFFRPSSGAHNCTYSCRYCQHWQYLKLYVQLFGNIKCINAKQAKETYQYRNIKSKLYKTSATLWYNIACREKQLTPNYISININGLTIPEAVCTVMCSWWWAEEPPETFRASVEINKSRKVASCWL